MELTYVTPLDGAFTKPVASKALGGMLAERGIELVTEFNTGSVDGEAGKLVSWDDREVPFDLAVVIPVHNGAPYVANSPGLGDELGFVPADEHTLQSKARPNVFAVGDAAALPISKAGSVTHFEGEVLVENIGRFLAGRPLDASYDGHANCFIETGFSKAMLIDFNYETEPLPGHFPGPVGLPLLKESHLNHLGKLMFQWLYWHSLLPGRDIPGITSSMPTRGKTPPRRDPEGGDKTHDAHHAGWCRCRSSTTRGSSSTPTNGPRTWRWSSPARRASTRSRTGTGRSIRFMRSEYFAKGTGPTVRVLGKTSGVSIKELYQLFPKGPAKIAAKIAGIPKPRGCI